MTTYFFDADSKERGEVPTIISNGLLFFFSFYPLFILSFRNVKELFGDDINVGMLRVEKSISLTMASHCSAIRTGERKSSGMSGIFLLDDKKKVSTRYEVVCWSIYCNLYLMYRNNS